MLGAMNAVEDARENIEDFLMLSDKKLMAELQRARLDSIKGKVGDWRALKIRYGVSNHSNRNI